jgi:hypothetical protein
MMTVALTFKIGQRARQPDSAAFARLYHDHLVLFLRFMQEAT